MSQTYILVGGGLASARAAEAIRERDAKGQIVVIGREPELPYNRPDLSKGYLLGKRPVEKIYYKPKSAPDPQSFYRERNIEVILSDPVAALDPEERQVTLHGGRVLDYDRLLLATGARARQLELPGTNLPNILTLRTLADATAIRDAATTARRAVLVGGGFIGAEVAAGLTQLGLSVTLALRESALLERALGRQAATFLTEYFQSKGVTVIPQTDVEAFVGADGRLLAVQVAGGREIPTDLVVVGAGVELNNELARQAKLELDPRLGNGIVTDEYLRTSRPEIYAAGDLAAFQSALYGRRMRIEHWDHARKSGQTAGRNMAGAEEVYRALPYFYSDLFDLDLQAYGDLYQWDEVVLRGPLDPAAKPALMQFYLDHGVLKGLLCINPPDDHYLDPLLPVLEGKPELDAEGRARLADPAAPWPAMG